MVMLGNLGKNLTNTMKKLAGMSVIDEKAVKEVVKDIQRAFIQSDINIKLVMRLSKRIEDRALNEKPPKGITPREYVITIVYEELVDLIGGEGHELVIKEKPFKIMFVGLQGSGKTTTIGKLCKFLQKKGFSPVVVCTDTWRPAAYEQLKQLTAEMQISLYGNPNNKDAVDLARKGLKHFKNQKIIIFDTAGRHKEEKNLLDEMKRLSDVIKPNEAMFVIDGTIGQQAGEQAKVFANTTDIGSIIITKLDGTAKGGGALSAVAEVGAPIKFIGTGEKLDDFELFDPNRFISRLLGMGDIKTLIEKAEEVVDKDVATETMNNMLSGKFTIKDMENQFAMMNKMGSMKQIMNMIPGFGGKIPKEASQMTEDKINRYKVIMSSMNDYEKDNPKVIKQSRVIRIAKGSGVKNEEVKELLKHYNNTKKTMKGIGKRGMGVGTVGRLMGQFMK
jgi:signal recognition particle subunit SRP54